MNEIDYNYRARLVEVLETLSSASQQLEYENCVPIAYVPFELACQFDTIFFAVPSFGTEEFSEEELKEMESFSRGLRSAVDEVAACSSPPVSLVLKLPKWNEMMISAARLIVTLSQRGGQAPGNSPPGKPI